MSSSVLRTVVGALALLVTLLWSAPAAGHSDLLSSEPEERQLLPTVPARVELVFSQPIVAELSQVELEGPDGVVANVGLLQAGATLVALFEGAGAVGQWAVIYRAAAEDGHLLTGRIEFAVGQPGGDRRDGPGEPVALAGLGLLVAGAWLLRVRLSARGAPR